MIAIYLNDAHVPLSLICRRYSAQSPLGATMIGEQVAKSVFQLAICNCQASDVCIGIIHILCVVMRN